MQKPHLQVLITEDVEDDALLTIDVLGRRFDVTFERVQTPEVMRDPTFLSSSSQGRSKKRSPFEQWSLARTITSSKTISRGPKCGR
jgi:hypothetical protein